MAAMLKNDICLGLLPTTYFLLTTYIPTFLLTIYYYLLTTTYLLSTTTYLLTTHNISLFLQRTIPKKKIRNKKYFNFLLCPQNKQENV